MILTLKRIARKPNYTIGRLCVNGAYVCDTLEPHCIDWTKEKKVDGKTAIPEGTYEIDMNTKSATFGNLAFYKTYSNGGKLPRLKNVPHFLGILIHVGNYPKDTRGCILVGTNSVVGAVMNSKAAYKRLFPMLLSASQKGETIKITIS